MPTLATVILTTKGECRKANLQLTSEVTLTIEIIQKYFKKKEEPEMVCSYEHENKNIYLSVIKRAKKVRKIRRNYLIPIRTSFSLVMRL